MTERDTSLDLAFTGERLHPDDALFGIDLLRHRAAYREAIRRAHLASAQHVLELGSGTGYGAAELADSVARLVAVDRVAPLPVGRASTARFVRGDLRMLPFAKDRFDLIVSFQVLEHLADPTPCLEAMTRLVHEDGTVLITTPNAAFSDGENPYHVHEYEAAELRQLLARFFEEVEMLGVSARGEALTYHEARLARIRRIVRIDPLGLRRILPLRLVEWLFARLAILVRRDVGAADRTRAVGLDDFPIEAAHPKSLDLFAICQGPRKTTS